MAENLRTPVGAAGETNDQDQESNLTSLTSLTSVTSVTSNVPGISDAIWTPALVGERLRKAVALETALNSERLVADIIAGRSPENRGIIGGIGGIGSGQPGHGDDGLVVHAAEAMAWLHSLEPDDADLVRARLGGAPWKSICWRFEISRPTADRRFRYALALIAWHLNGPEAGGRAPSLRSLLGIHRAA